MSAALQIIIVALIMYWALTPPDQGIDWDSMPDDEEGPP